MAQTFGSRWTRLMAAALLAIPALGQAQGGATISGTVSERGSNNPLERAQVSIVGKAIAVATDAKGGFTLRGVDAGTVTVRAQYIGYEAREQVVQVTANGTLRVNFALSRTAVTLSGVMVTATGEDFGGKAGTSRYTGVWRTDDTTSPATWLVSGNEGTNPLSITPATTTTTLYTLTLRPKSGTANTSATVGLVVTAAGNENAVTVPLLVRPLTVLITP